MMPGEEMEITTDFGHAGFGEEIDIDLDFAVGQHDGDLELADFDQTQDIQNFNVDTRDELMAEGDDASYGMIDADDIEQNEVAAAANDIEIDLGDPEENLWAQEGFHGESFENVDEIDYVEENAIGGNDFGSTSVTNIDHIEGAPTDEQPAADATEEQLPALSNEAAAQGSPQGSLRDSLQGSPKNGPTDSPHLATVDEAPELGEDEYNRAVADEEQVSVPAASVHSLSEEQLSEQPAKEQQPEEDHTSELINDQNKGDGDVALGNEDFTETAGDDYVLSVAARHNMYVMYHDVAYRLFAESEDDDPNRYFLSDMSALEFTLGKFVSSLRNVIDEEVSPLDELVVTVDGLAIEIAESSKPELLNHYTFGEILTLYDKLAQNDEEGSTVDIFLHLDIIPNCLKRLMALNESAVAGIGLSEVGVFKESGPAQYLDAENQGDEDPAEEYQANEDQVGEDRTGDDEAGDDEAGEDQSGEDQAGEFQGDEGEPKALSQSPHEPDGYGSEGDERDDAQETEYEATAKSPSLHASVAEVETANPAKSLEKTVVQDEQKNGSITNENVNEEEADDVIDYSDDDLDVSQQDQQANAPLGDNAHEAQKESNDTATSENSASNQHPSPFNGLTDAAVSVATSATATLTGDDKDEIDYSDDDDAEINGGNDDLDLSVDGPPNDGTSTNGAAETPRLQLPVDDEITWESDEEDANEVPPTAPRDVVQVSPSGKRPRADSDLSESETGPIGVKRRRSS